MSLSRTSILAYLALVFASGAVLGVFGDRVYSAYTAVSTVRLGGPKGPPRTSPDDLRKHRTQEFQARLKLSDAQVTQLGLIYDETRVLYEEQRKRTQPELDAINKNQQDKILAILNADQRIEYEKSLKEREGRGKKGGGPPGRPPGF